jgi:hypothetical protein
MISIFYCHGFHNFLGTRMLCSIIIFLFFTLTQCELLQLPDESLSIPEECTDSTLSSTNYEDLKGKFPS